MNRRSGRGGINGDDEKSRMFYLQAKSNKPFVGPISKYDPNKRARHGAYKYQKRAKHQHRSNSHKRRQSNPKQKIFESPTNPKRPEKNSKPLPQLQIVDSIPHFSKKASPKISKKNPKAEPSSRRNSNSTRRKSTSIGSKGYLKKIKTRSHKN